MPELKFRADDDLVALIERAALDDDRSRSEIIRRACRAYLLADSELGAVANGTDDTFAPLAGGGRGEDVAYCERMATAR